jgi:hypothetical protein
MDTWITVLSLIASMAAFSCHWWLTNFSYCFVCSSPNKYWLLLISHTQTHTRTLSLYLSPCFKFKVIFWPMVSRSVRLGIKPPPEAYDQIFIIVGYLKSSCWVAPFPTRWRVRNVFVQFSVILGQVPQNPWPYFTVSFETPQTWRASSPYLYTPGTEWPSFAPRAGIPLRRFLRLAELPGSRTLGGQNTKQC